MTTRISASDRLAELRQQAEQSTKRSADHPPTEHQQLIHDLQVHQIELEMQNEELHRTQEQLNESLEKYADLYDFAPVGYITLDREGIILEANLTFSSQLGSDRTRLIDTPLWLYTATEDRGRLQTHLEEVFTTEDQQRCEILLQNPTGRKSYMQLDSIQARNGNGPLVCRTSVTDISVRRDAEQELIRIHDELERRVQERTAELFINERKFRILSKELETLLGAITDTLILFSPNMTVLWSNSEMSGQLHDRELEMTREFCHALIDDSAFLSPANPIKRCFNTGEKEVAIKTFRGAMLDLRVFPIKEAAKVHSVLLLVSDITDKMAMQAESMQAGHMAALGELASGVAHEINNPITGIINYGQILVNECPAESMEKDIGMRIVKEGDRVGRIVKILLSYARDGGDEKKPTCVSTIVEESIVLTKAQIRKEGINFKINLAADLPHIHANLQQMQQSFINIINNARYALNEKYPGQHEEKLLEITGEQITVDSRPYIRLVFFDRGIGIEPKEIPLLTRQFFSNKPFGRGTGLGLHITEKIIKDHGGYLSFDSSKGEYTRVIVDLPVDSHENGGAR